MVEGLLLPPIYFLQRLLFAAHQYDQYDCRLAHSDMTGRIQLLYCTKALLSTLNGFQARLGDQLYQTVLLVARVLLKAVAFSILVINGVVCVAIGTASVARGLSNYIDALADNAMSNALTEAMPIGVSWLSPYPDFLSCGFILLLSCEYSLYFSLTVRS